LIPTFLIPINVLIGFITWKKLNFNEKNIIFSFTIFQIILILYNSYFSGWIFWPWYYYPFVINYAIFIIFICKIKFNFKYLFISSNFLIILYLFTFILF